jgi:hypothetical protein
MNSVASGGQIGLAVLPCMGNPLVWACKRPHYHTPHLLMLQ